MTTLELEMNLEGWYRVVNKLNPSKSVASFEYIMDAQLWIKQQRNPNDYEIVEYDSLLIRRGIPPKFFEPKLRY